MNYAFEKMQEDNGGRDYYRHPLHDNIEKNPQMLSPH